MDRNTFVSLHREYGVVPVWRDLLGDSLGPVPAYQALRGMGDRFLLESVETGRSWGRFSFVGADPAAVVVRRHGQVELDGALLDGYPTDSLRSVLGAVLEALPAPRIDGMPPLYSGVVGVLGAGSLQPYPHDFDRLPPSLAHTDALLMLPRTVIAFDHLRQVARVIRNVFTSEESNPDIAFDSANVALDKVIDLLRQAPPLPLVGVPSFDQRIDLRAEVDDQTYGGLLDAALGHVRSGEVEQLAVSRRYWVDARVPTIDVYRMLRIMNPSPYMYLFDVRCTGVVGSSPQALVSLRDRVATTSAIGGSRPRGADATTDAAHARDLAADPKELTEHRQLVAQAMADLVPFVRPGSVEVDPAPTVRTFSHVMHLVTTMRGELTDAVSPMDLLAGSTPAGTVCGSPREAASRIGSSLERSPRGLYGGAVGYLDFCGNIDVCIGIRTLFVEGSRYWSQAGASVVAGSHVEAEVRESAMKVKAVFAAVAAAMSLNRGDDADPSADEATG